MLKRCAFFRPTFPSSAFFLLLAWHKSNVHLEAGLFISTKAHFSPLSYTCCLNCYKGNTNHSLLVASSVMYGCKGSIRQLDIHWGFGACFPTLQKIAAAPCTCFSVLNPKSASPRHSSVTRLTTVVMEAMNRNTVVSACLVAFFF